MNGDVPLPDKYMTATSEYDANHNAKYARLHNQFGVSAGAWLPTEADFLSGNSYIQVFFIYSSLPN